MTFYATLAGTDTHADLVLALFIEGVPVALVERPIPAAVATSIPATQLACITRVEEGEAVLDVDERRELGATLQIDLLDDDAKTLASLFAVNTRRKTWLTADATASATALTVFSTTGLSNGQTIYVDGETIRIGTVASATSLTGCTRGDYLSTARPLFGTPTGYEDPIYIVPPSWRGRRAYLYGYVLDAAGGGFEQLLGTWIVDEPPRHVGDLSWSLSLASCAQEYYERSIGFGLSSTTRTVGAYTAVLVGGRTAYRYDVDNASAFRLSSLWTNYVVVKAGDRSAIFELQAVDTLANTITIYTDPCFGTTRETVLADVETFYPLSVAWMARNGILYALLSKEGQAATTYDRLPGRQPTSVDPGWRMGAGFVSGEIDVSAFEEFGAVRPGLLVVDKEQRVSDILREWCQLNGAATRVTVDGKLSVFTLATPRVTSTTMLDSGSVVPDSRIEVTADEESISPLATVRCDYSPLEGESRLELNLIDRFTAKRYPRIQRRAEIDLRTIAVSDKLPLGASLQPYTSGASLSLGELQQIAFDIQRGDNGLARRFVSLSLTMAHLSLRIGDVVTLSSTLPDAFSALPDMRGGTLGGVQCRVVSRRPRYDAGRVDVRLLVLDPLLLVSPGAAISSLAGTTLTLATTGPEVSGASPANDFYAGVNVRIYDVSAGVVHNTTVSSITSGTQLVVASAPVFAGGIQANVDYIVADVAASTVSGTSVSGYVVTEWAALANSAGIVSTTVGSTEPRWR